MSINPSTEINPSNDCPSGNYSPDFYKKLALALVPHCGNKLPSQICLYDAQDSLLQGIQSSLDVFQASALEVCSGDGEIQMSSESLVGVCQTLTQQLDALRVINEEVSLFSQSRVGRGGDV